MKRGTMLFLLLAVCLLPMLQTGSDVDQQAYVIIMALDARENGKIRVALQLPSGQSMRSDAGSEGSENSAGYQTVEATATSYLEALDIVNATVMRRLNYTQVRQILFSETLARSDAFLSLLEEVARTPNIRASAPCVISRGGAMDFMRQEKPFLGLRLSEYLEIGMRYYHEQSNMPIAPLGALTRTMEHGYTHCLTAYAATNAFDNPEEPSPGRPLDELPGRLPRKSSDANEYLGAALMDHRRMVGTLTGLEMQYLAIMQGDVNNLLLSIDGVPYHITQRTTARKGVAWQTEGCMLTLWSAVTAYPAGSARVTADRIRMALEEGCTNVLQKLQALGTDPLGFGGIAVRTVSTMRQWDAQRWLAYYGKADIAVTIEVTMRESL